MNVLCLKLTGPLQAWPAHSRGTTRATYRAPTYSALVGLAACALGEQRASSRVDPLEQCSVAVRVDNQGVPAWDFHSINPLPSPDNRFTSQRDRRPAMLNMSGGSYAPTVLTKREYLQDASFVCFIAGPTPTIQHLDSALRAPRWATFLGRKACAPGPDVVLGVFTLSLEKLVRELPVVHGSNETAPGRVAREVHWLDGSPSGEPAAVERWSDQPFGAVGASYRSRSRGIVSADCVAVGSRREQFEWIAQNRITGTSND